MNNSQILKLIFNHDQRLAELAPTEIDSNTSDANSVLADFMRPDPTYSRLYFTASDLENETFGINTLTEYTSFLDAIEKGLQSENFSTKAGSFNDLDSAINAIEFGEVVVIQNNDNFTPNISDLHRSNPEFKTVLKKSLENGLVIIYKDEAPNGFNLHLFSKKNIYQSLFYPLQKLLPVAFRFFSINGKKFKTERHFYFETWTLDRPPHGFEEVFVESVL
ncbi:MAG: hypothetical protein JXR20_12200 [Balneola sp.]